MSRVYLALAEKDKHKKRWDESLQFIRLTWFEKNLPLADFTERTEVHWAWGYFNSVIPTLYARNPTRFVKPRTVRSTPFAETMQEVLAYYAVELKLKDQVQRCIADAIVYGMGWMEVGYDPTEVQRRELQSLRKPSLAERMTRQLNEFFAQKPDDQETDQTEGQLLPERKKGQLYRRWLPAWSVLLAPNYHLVRQMPYLILIEDMEREEMLRNPNFDPQLIYRITPTRQLSRLKETGGMNSPLPRRIGSFTRSGSPSTDFIRTYTVWDRRNRQVFTLCEGISDFLHWQRWPSSFDEFPQVPLIFNDTPPSEENAYGYAMDDLTPLKPLLMEKSLLRTSMVKARRRMVPHIVVDENQYTEDEIRKLQSNEEFAIIPLKGGAQGIQPIVLRLPDDIYRIDSVIDNDLNRVSNFSDLFLSGQSPSKINTATEANISQMGMNVRQARKIDILEDFIVEISRREAAFCWENCTADDIMEILEKPVTSDMWPDLPESASERQRIINKELSFYIESNSTQPEQVRLVEQNIWIRAFNMIKAVWPDRIKDEVALKQLLKKIGAKDIEAMVKSDDEAEMLNAQQENQLMLQGAPQAVGPNDIHSVHIPIHGQAASTSDSPLLDKHILEHARLQAAQTPGAGQKPQAGDISSPAQAGVPELQREGGENMADLLGQGASVSQGLGPETSMVP